MYYCLVREIAHICEHIRTGNRWLAVHESEMLMICGGYNSRGRNSYIVSFGRMNGGKIVSAYTLRNLSEILFNQVEIRLYLPFI